MRQVNNTKYSFNIANKAYFDSKIEIRPCMKEILEQEIEKVNFTEVTLLLLFELSALF